MAEREWPVPVHKDTGARVLRSGGMCTHSLSSSVFFLLWYLISRKKTLSYYTRLTMPDTVSSQGLLKVTDGELRDAGVEDATHRQTILDELSRHRQGLDPRCGNNKGRFTCWSQPNYIDLFKMRWGAMLKKRFKKTKTKQNKKISCSVNSPSQYVIDVKFN